MPKRPPAEQSTDDPLMPVWFDFNRHLVTPAGIRDAATGDLLGEDGLPVNTHARAAALAATTNTTATEE